MSNFYKLTLNSIQKSRLSLYLYGIGRSVHTLSMLPNRMAIHTLLLVCFASSVELRGNPGNEAVADIVGMDACFECIPIINMDLDSDCEYHVTASLLLEDMLTAEESDFSIELSFANGLIISDNVLRLQHVGQEILAKVSYLGGGICTQGYQCQTKINLGHSSTVGMVGTPKTVVYCTDPFLQLDPASADYPNKPTISSGCGGGGIGPFFAGDWVMLNACGTNEDTAKTIMRQWWAESKDGDRRMITDTIKVLLIPPLSDANFSCASMDTVYCNDTVEQIGPYLVLPGLDGSACDTLFLMDDNRRPVEFDASCGIGVQLDSVIFESSGCVQITEYTLQVHQSCAGLSDELMSGDDCYVEDSEVIIEESPGVVFASCSFWLVDLDTLPPVVSCDLSGFGDVDTIGGKVTYEVAAGADCYANMVLPPVLAEDKCNNVSFVRATIDTLGTYLYTYDVFSDEWIARETQPLLARPEPYTIYLEAKDDCGNLSLDSCAVIISDLTAPVVVTHFNLNFPLTGPLSWIDYGMVDDGSYDNCEIEYLLVRRADWQDDWDGFCDSIDLYLDTPSQDSLWEKYIESDFSLNEFESYYGSVLLDFTFAPSIAGTLVYQAWLYDLRRYATVDCLGKLTLEAFNTLYAELHPLLDVAELAEIGGGWAPKAPFTCDDACQTLKVELLAVDSRGNWSVGWSNVLVEDKMDPTVEQELATDVAMSCTAYNDDQSYQLPGISGSIALSEVVGLAASGDVVALALLDSLFGGYQVGYLSGPDYIDVDGQIIQDVTFEDRGGCLCLEGTREISYYDFNTGQMEEKDSVVTICSRDTADLPVIQNGVVGANCNLNTQIIQTVTADVGDCGGTITRTFTITNTCAGASPVGIVKTQTITVGDTCTLTKWMFDLPGDTVIYACQPELDADENVIGVADPALTGEPVFLFDVDCRIIGIAREDLNESSSNPDRCNVIRRTWYFADWCEDIETDDWWLDQSLITDSFTQIIVIADTLDPECQLEVMGKDQNGVVTVANCASDGVQISFSAFDACALDFVNYTVERIEVGMNDTIHDITEDAIGMDYIDMKSLIMNEPGEYIAITTATDLCGNDSTCRDTFTLDCSISRQSGLVDMEMDQMPVGKASQILDNGSDVSNPIIPDVGHSKGGDGFALYQNRPNPFSNHTIVGFHLPEVDEVRLTVYNTNGQQLKQIVGKYPKGYHEMDLDFGDYNAAGVLYYQLDTKTFSATRRMVVTP